MSAIRAQLIGLGGVVERNSYLIKRYGWWELAFFVWTVANTLTIVFIADGVEAAGGTLDVERQTTILLIGAVIWSYLGIVFEILTETVAWERWEGTIEYTFMAPLSRAVHLLGMGAFAVLYGVVRTSLLFVVVAVFFGLTFPDANFAAYERIGSSVKPAPSRARRIAPTRPSIMSDGATMSAPAAAWTRACSASSCTVASLTT